MLLLGYSRSGDWGLVVPETDSGSYILVRPQIEVQMGERLGTKPREGG